MLQKAEEGGDFQHTQPIRAGLGAREKHREVGNNWLIFTQSCCNIKLIAIN